MKQRVHALEEQPHGREATMAAIRQEWANLTRLELETLVESMARRIEACIQALGGHAK